MKWLTQEIKNLAEMFYPDLCIACNDRLVSQEKFLCMHCWHDLPVTNFHLSTENKVAMLFWGRVQIENATSYFAYNKGSNYQHLIHFIKYKGLKELGFETGLRFGHVLKTTASFADADIIVPVPLHPEKEKQRGYNQSDWIARGLGTSMQKPVSVKNLVRKVHTSTQTRKNRFERWENVDNIFEIRNPDEFAGKLVLLTDDVVTTGSTLEACASALLKISDTRVSIATLAFADY
jgi:ComF family protein